MKRDVRIGICPECGGSVVARDGFYGCSGYQEGCRFTVSVHALAAIGHPVLSTKQMRKLLKGPVQMIFKMANGTERLFYVSLERVDGRWRPIVDFDQGAHAPVAGACPLCGADVIEYPLSFGCTRWEEGCEFAIFKNAVKRFGGKMLGISEIKSLLKDGHIEVTIKGFDKRPKRAILYLDETYGCTIDFDSQEE